MTKEQALAVVADRFHNHTLLLEAAEVLAARVRELERECAQLSELVVVDSDGSVVTQTRFHELWCAYCATRGKE